jgi:hypothetical protein
MTAEYSNSFLERQTLIQEHKKYALAKVQHYTNPMSLTLTFIGSASAARELGEERFQTLLHKLSKKVNKNAFRRHRELISCVAVQEFDDHTRNHIHAIFDVPERTTQEQFFNILESFAREQFDLRLSSTRDKKNVNTTPLIHVSKWNGPKAAVEYLFKNRSKDTKENFSTFVIA